ncbi:MAG: hypothetical protein PHV77_01990 [Candidatus Omnitrophica bacterium]|jgi:hypothetical protein|nr:hypothetical protein [Candidatus Omnitrophota bacterium]
MIKLILLSVLLIALFPAVSGAVTSGSQETWESMLTGIRRYSSDRKLNEEYEQLVKDHPTALVNGKVHTGDGLYMDMDITVYNYPGGAKMTQLAPDTIVVLTGQKREFEASLWKEIKFLYTSRYTETAVGIEKAWIPDSCLKHENNGPR